MFKVKETPNRDISRTRSLTLLVDFTPDGATNVLKQPGTCYPWYQTLDERRDHSLLSLGVVDDVTTRYPRDGVRGPRRRGSVLA